MLNWIWMGMIVAGIMGRFTGENGIVEGMFDSIEKGVVGLVIPLCAIIMLWLGIMRLGEKSGMIQAVARFFRPLTKWLFPDVPSDHPAMSAMVMNFAANLLGLGNAAPPLGLKGVPGSKKLATRRYVAKPP